jgi:DNA invertase Pin-like site-specific DNA recombinase
VHVKPAAAIYLRVSKDDGSQTTDNQRPDVEQMAAGRGYVVAPEHVYVDEASGAKGADERPALAAMLTAAARGRFRAVFVWRLDRLSRDDTFRGGLSMIGDLDRFNVALLSHQETWIDTSGPFRLVFVQIAMTLAAEERRVLIARTKAGIARARAAGKHIGRKPHGIPERAQDKGNELRGPQDGRSVLMPWRAVAVELERLGFGKWNHATLARACTQRLLEKHSGAPRPTRVSG